jgi:hypothetical protein
MALGRQRRKQVSLGVRQTDVPASIHPSVRPIQLTEHVSVPAETNLSDETQAKEDQLYQEIGKLKMDLSG